MPAKPIELFGKRRVDRMRMSSHKPSDSPVDDRDHLIDCYRLIEEVSVLVEIEGSLLDQ